MNKIVKRRLINAIICFAIGISIVVYSMVNTETMREELSSYLNGFSSGVIGVGLYFLICTIRAIRNPKIAQNLENMNNDERLNSINHKAMATTFRMSVIVEAIGSLVSAFWGNMQIAECLGFVICVQLIVYIMIYYGISSKN